MKSVLTLAAGLVAALALMATPAGAITGNYEKDFEHDYVGLIVFYDAQGEFLWRCSGALVSSRVFLTAGHCTDQGESDSPSSARIYFRQDAGAHYDRSIQMDPRSGYPDECRDDPLVPNADEVCVTAGQLHDYGFDNFAGFPNHRDVGVAILDTPVTTLGYGSLPAPNYLTDLAASTKKNDIWLTSSGYGVTSHVPRIESYRERFMTNSYIVNLHNSLTDGFNIQSTANPGGDKGGTCNGDSGGPVYRMGTHMILGVTSFGLNHRCKGLDFAYRIDRPDVLNWINSYVTTYG